MDQEEWLVIDAETVPKEIKAGSRGLFVIRVTIPKDCHINAHEVEGEFMRPTVLVLDPSEGLSFGEFGYPKPKEIKFGWSDKPLHTYDGTFEIRVPVSVREEAEKGPKKVKGKLTYQGCTASMCLPPGEHDIEIEFAIV